MADTPSVAVNKQTLTPNETVKWMEQIKKCKSAVNIAGNENDAQANNYWYDRKSGLWGWVGGPIQGKFFYNNNITFNFVI